MPAIRLLIHKCALEWIKVEDTCLKTKLISTANYLIVILNFYQKNKNKKSETSFVKNKLF